jgi:D-alanine-D-alanine ligase
MNIEFGITDLESLRKISQLPVYEDGFVIQPYLSGWIDLNIAVSLFPEISVSSVERPLKQETGILGFEEKYLSGAGGMEAAKREIPAAIPSSIRERIEQAAILTVKSMGLRGVPRVDFLWNGSDLVYLCEVNSIPGAMGLYLWESAGRTREEILCTLIEESARSLPEPDHWAKRNDQRALTVARSLASKLRI